MVEEEKQDVLEKEFRDLEAELVEKIKVVYKESLEEFPAGVTIEIVADKEKFFRLYIDSKGKWNVRYAMSGFPLADGELSNVLDHYLVVTDEPYRNLDDYEQKQYLANHKEATARSLIDRMQTVLNDLA